MTNELDVMLDLETTGVNPGCGILSIGACTFDLSYQFYQRISPEDSNLFLKDEIDTLRWWNKQNPATRQEAFGGTKSLLLVLCEFEDWFSQLPAARTDINIWSNGADFDLPILKAAYMIFDKEVPWAPYSGRCHRTLKNLLPHVKAPTNANKHNALEDAISQARHAVSILQVL